MILKKYISALALSMLATASGAASVTQFRATGATAADIQSTVDAFRTALGQLNAPAPVNGDPNGRRQINWDAAPDQISDPNRFPGDFFNGDAAPRARGIRFRTLTTALGVDDADDDMKLSATAASGQPVLFGRSDDFTTFSAERLFAPLGTSTVVFAFDDPANSDNGQLGVPRALSRGIGVVFTDNDQAFDPKQSINQIFGGDLILPKTPSNAALALVDGSGEALGTFVADRSPNKGLSFLGLLFDEPMIAAGFVQAGTISIDRPGVDGVDGDYVAMDDFIFGEPVPAPVPLPASALLLLCGVGGLIRLRRRKG